VNIFDHCRVVICSVVGTGQFRTVRWGYLRKVVHVVFHLSNFSQIDPKVVFLEGKQHLSLEGNFYALNFICFL